MTLFRLLSLSGLAAAFTGSALPAWAFPANLQPIAAALEQRGWKVLLEAPPRKGIYGMANSRKRRYGCIPLRKRWESCLKPLCMRLCMLFNPVKQER